MSTPLRYRRQHQPAPAQAAPGQLTQPLSQAVPSQFPQGHRHPLQQENIKDQYGASQYAGYAKDQQPYPQAYPQQYAQYYPAQQQQYMPYGAQYQQYAQYMQSSQQAYPAQQQQPVYRYPGQFAQNMQPNGYQPSAQARDPSSGESSPNANAQPVQRKPRPYNRADRAMGRIVDPEFEPAANKDVIEKLIAATATPVSAQSPEPSPEDAAQIHRFNSAQSKANALVKCSVNIKLPSRQVTKKLEFQTTAASLASQLVREHRLEFDFEHNNAGDGEEIILWESVDGTRRPLRANEQIGPIVQRWGKWGSRCCLRTTSTVLRHDVDSLASLVPRRDMLRTAPKLAAADVHFSRPSVMYNPHMNGGYISDPRSPPMSPISDHSLDWTKAASKGKITDSTNRPGLAGQGMGEDGGNGGSGLQRVPSKLNPSDKGLVAKRIYSDNDDVALQSQLVWGFGELDLGNGKLVLKQKPGDELVCALELAGTDVYEWPHAGPKRYVIVLRAQQPNSRAVYVSTESAKVFSVLRNAVFTARTKSLLDQQQRKRLN